MRRATTTTLGLLLLGAAGLSFAACGEPAPRRLPGPKLSVELSPDPEPWSEAWLLAEGQRYLEDAAFRRQSVQDSLRNHENLYSRTRIASYGLGDRGWDRLPPWNPRSRTLTRTDRAALEAGETLTLPEEVGPLWDGETPTTAAGWIALGREVFHRYPLRADGAVEHGLRDRALSERLGLHATPDGSTPGVLLFADLDGQDHVGIACAVCHTFVADDGSLTEGRARRAVDYGALQLALADSRGQALDPNMRRRMDSWGPGRADITEDDDEDPVAIPDLWGLRHQSSLTQAGTIVHVGPIALALRQETQYLYANHHRSRPPRELVWALVMFLYSLEPAPQPAPDDAALVARGETLFSEQSCTDCHDNPALGGEVVRAERVGTDPGLSQGVARGTGMYRPSALVRVADAAPYLHHGAVATLEDMFDPARLTDAYRGPLGRGAVPGHDYGTELDAADRDALLGFLRSL